MRRSLQLFTVIACVVDCAPARPGLPSVSRARASCDGDARFVLVSSGFYALGSTAAERDNGYRVSAISRGGDATAVLERQLRSQGWFDREREATRVRVRGVCIERTLVTNEAYAAFVAATGHRAPGITEREYAAQGFLVHSYDEVRPYLWRDGAFPRGESRHPVVLVSWDDALAYARWRGERDARHYDLPTREEWESAARGTDGRYFPWGNTWRNDGCNWMLAGRGHTSEVGAFGLSRGPSGAEDMAGNVFQWTATRAGDRAVLKGCGWDDLAGFCRGAYEHSRRIDSRHVLIGFRLVWR